MLLSVTGGGGHHQVLGDSGLGKDGLCGQEEEWNQRCVGYYVIVMYVLAHNEL